MFRKLVLLAPSRRTSRHLSCRWFFPDRRCMWGLIYTSQVRHVPRTPNRVLEYPLRGSSTVQEISFHNVTLGTRKSGSLRLLHRRVGDSILECEWVHEWSVRDRRRCFRRHRTVTPDTDVCGFLRLQTLGSEKTSDFKRCLRDSG